MNPPVRNIVKLTLLTVSTLTVMAGAIISAALPDIRAHFAGVENADFLVRLLLTLPALFIVFGAPLAGMIVDRFGRKPILVFSTLLYGVAGGSGYTADSLPLMLLGRAVLGIAVAGVMTSATTLIADYFTGKARANFLGLQAAFVGLGGTVFLALGGVLADIEWRAPFLIYLIAFLILPFIVFVLYEPAVERETTPGTLAPVTAGAPVRLMLFGYLTLILVQVAFYTVPVELPFYLQDILGATGTVSGIAVAAMSLFYAIASALFGRINDRFDHLSVIYIGLALTGVGFVLLSLARGWLLIALALPLGGFGIGLIMPNINSWLADETPSALRGRVLSGFTMSVFLGQFLSPIITSPIGTGATLYGSIAVSLLVMSGAVFAARKLLTGWITPAPAGVGD